MNERYIEDLETEVNVLKKVIARIKEQAMMGQSRGWSHCVLCGTSYQGTDDTKRHKNTCALRGM